VQKSTDFFSERIIFFNSQVNIRSFAWWRRKFFVCQRRGEEASKSFSRRGCLLQETRQFVHC